MALTIAEAGQDRRQMPSGEVIPFDNAGRQQPVPVSLVNAGERLYLLPEAKRQGFIDAISQINWHRPGVRLAKRRMLGLEETCAIPDMQLSERVQARKKAISAIDRRLERERKSKEFETTPHEEALIAIRTALSAAQAHEARQLRIIHRAENERRRKLKEKRQGDKLGTHGVIYRAS